MRKFIPYLGYRLLRRKAAKNKFNTEKHHGIWHKKKFWFGAHSNKIYPLRRRFMGRMEYEYLQVVCPEHSRLLIVLVNRTDRLGLRAMYPLIRELRWILPVFCENDLQVFVFVRGVDTVARYPSYFSALSKVKNILIVDNFLDPEKIWRSVLMKNQTFEKMGLIFLGTSIFLEQNIHKLGPPSTPLRRPVSA